MQLRSMLNSFISIHACNLWWLRKTKHTMLHTHSDVVWYCVGQGVLGHTLSPVRQVFERIPSVDAVADADSRFQHFKKHVWLRIKESGASGPFLSLCFLPSQTTHLTASKKHLLPAHQGIKRCNSVLSFLPDFPLTLPAFFSHHFRKRVRLHIENSGAASDLFLAPSLVFTFKSHALPWKLFLFVLVVQAQQG